MKMSTTPAGVKSILGALEYFPHCLPSFKLLGDPLIDIIKVETNKDFTPTDIHHGVVNQPFCSLGAQVLESKHMLGSLVLGLDAQRVLNEL